MPQGRAASAETWLDTVLNFGRWFKRAAGRASGLAGSLNCWVSPNARLAGLAIGLASEPMNPVFLHRVEASVDGLPLDWRPQVLLR